VNDASPPAVREIRLTTGGILRKIGSIPPPRGGHKEKSCVA